MNVFQIDSEIFHSKLTLKKARQERLELIEEINKVVFRKTNFNKDSFKSTLERGDYMKAAIYYMYGKKPKDTDNMRVARVWKYKKGDTTLKEYCDRWNINWVQVVPLTHFMRTNDIGFYLSDIWSYMETIAKDMWIDEVKNKKEVCSLIEWKDKVKQLSHKELFDLLFNFMPDRICLVNVKELNIKNIIIVLEAKNENID